MALGALLGGIAGGIREGLGDVQQVQQIHAEGQRQQAQQEMSQYASDAIKNNTDPMDFAQNMYAMSVKAGDQQAAAHWYGAYNDQKQVKTNHALIGAYTAADQGDADLASSYFNKYAGYAGLGDKAEAVPHVDPATGQETRTIALTAPDGRRTELPPDKWGTIAKARLAIELSNLEAQQKIPYWQQQTQAQTGNIQAQTGHTQAMTPVDVAKGTAETGNIQAQTATEQQRPGLVRAQTGATQAQGALSGAEAGEVRATTPGKVALLGAQGGETRAQAGYLGEQAKTVAAMRDPNVTKTGAETIGTLADANYKNMAAQNALVAQPSEIGARDAQAEETRARAGYYDRGGRPTATRGPQPWTKEDQATMQEAIGEHTGVGNDPLTGAKVTSGQPSYPELADPRAQRAMAPLTQSLMTAPGNQGSLRNNAAGAAELAAAIIAHRATVVRNRATGKITADYGGVTYEVPPAALAGANVQGAGSQAPGGAGGPSVPMQRQ